MFKKFLLVLSIFCMLPVCAGELEDALDANKSVFLYLYSQKCGYCIKFNPIYHKLTKMYDKHYTFVKVDANTPYGFKLMREYRGGFVPFVLLIDPQHKTMNNIPPSCLTETVCVEKAMQTFNKK